MLLETSEVDVRNLIIHVTFRLMGGAPGITHELRSYLVVPSSSYLPFIAIAHEIHQVIGPLISYLTLEHGPLLHMYDL